MDNFNYKHSIVFIIFLQLFAPTLQCGDWERFDQKCYKIVANDQLKTYDEAKKQCSYMASRILTVTFQVEQNFLSNFFAKNNLSDVWIGLKKNSRGQFAWDDKSVLDYTNWGSGSPTTKPDHNCVEMAKDKRFWVNTLCSKRNAVVCQIPYMMPQTELQALVLRMEAKLKQTEKQLQELTENVTVKYMNIPIGFVYVQLPNQSEPRLLFPNTEWSEISKQYSGMFFRTSGEGAAPFGKEQAESSPRIVKVESLNDFKPRDARNIRVFDENANGVSKWSKELFVGDDTRGKNWNRTIRFGMSMAEVRPKNVAVRIWMRVK